MTIDDLDNAVRVSFLAGYEREDNLYEQVILGIKPAKTWSDEAEEQPFPEAYRDGRRLRDQRARVMSASLSEHAADVAAFDRLAEEINSKYGHIVASSQEPNAFNLRRETSS